MTNTQGQRTCDLCKKTYMLNSERIPRIIIRKKVIINDLTAKHSYANPDYCQDCISIIFLFLQRKTPFRYSIKNEQINNTYFNTEELELLNAIKKR